ncbi:MAG: exodeoxyribonuclease VII large subunit [Clostridia bacterium]
MEYHPITVTQLNHYVKEKIESDAYLANVLVKGEISNFKHHFTGHMYFTLKDENSLIKCVMFKTYTSHLAFMPKDGMQVMVLGTVSVFERDGVYQIYAKAMQEEGKGDLHQEFEKLKAKLEQEGLFDVAHKKPIPFLPSRIGVLTSNTGAVIRDIINVSTRRNPNVHICLLPVPVQGPGAAEKIAKAIQTMNERKLADVIIVARGGGSLEDLWPFNEEIVARAIYHSELPIISAVGHETDFTIADFVADLRAPTPSAAAELAVPQIEEVILKLNQMQSRMALALKKRLEMAYMRLEKCLSSRIYQTPLQPIQEKYMLLDRNVKALENAMKNQYLNSQTKFITLAAKLDTLSPLKTLARGYTIINKGNTCIHNQEQLEIGDEITIHFHDGNREATVIK